MTAREGLARITATVGYLRIHVSPDEAERDWLRCADLLADPPELLELARAAGPHLGTDEDDVAMSLFVQGYAYRIAAVAVGGWLLADELVDVAPSGLQIALARGRPNAVRFAEPRIAVAAPAPVEAVHEQLVDGHLDLLVNGAHEACRIGRPLLWGNVAASIAAAFGAFMDPLPDRRDDIRRRVLDFFATARPELSGSVVPVGARWMWQRTACCLWYRTSSAFRCDDCSLWTTEERQARHDRKVAEQIAAGEIAADEVIG
jgi:ferric iron reductase protein FhuF